MSTDPSPDKHPDKEETPDQADPSSSDMGEVSFWDESQIQQVVRHAGQSGRSPEEFFNKKWKDKFIHHKPDEKAPPADEAEPSGQ